MVSPRQSLDWCQTPFLCHDNSYASHPCCTAGLDHEIIMTAPELKMAEASVDDNTSDGEERGFGRIEGVACWVVGSAVQSTTFSLSVPGARCFHSLYRMFQTGCAMARESRPLIHRARALATPVRSAIVIITKQIERWGDMRRGGNYVEWTVVTIFTSTGRAFI